ncbi:DUF4254 domain-containing protein [Nocardia pseudovaccinii]|uniref:DUF4254 domain-containing protein n=1 Tax=Nocardia pseudovaccinii TaxID=189540 RepID=UPI0007A3E833|nr:DUF4254 domain-containing protein [Nocardia pseudovaccinii]
MRTPLPSREMILQACAGTVAIGHPILQGAYELASLHEARLDRGADIGTIDRERDRLVSRIDSWVSADQLPAFDAAYHHTETVGMVIDRLAQFSVAARVASQQSTSTLEFRYTQHRLTELAVAYSDLCFEIAAGTRRLPDFSFPVLERDSTEPDHRRGL